MARTRWLLGVIGVGVAAYGGLLLWGLGRTDLREALVWLGAGVVLHDLLLVPLVAVAWLLVRRLLPVELRGPVGGGLLVLGSLTLLAVPVLGRFGATPDNPTLLDRPYGAGWVVLAGLVGLVVLVMGWRRRRATRHGRVDRGSNICSS